MQLEEILKEIKRLNDNLENLVEVGQDFNKALYKKFGGKVKYEKGDKEA